MRHFDHLIRALPRMALLAAALVAVTAVWGLDATQADAAEIAASGAEQVHAPQQAAPDEGGTGVNNFDREEWYEFSILLAPFLVLVTFILILMFMWDRHSGEEG